MGKKKDEIAMDESTPEIQGETATAQASAGRKNLYYVGGSKGGIGKSIVSMGLLHYLLMKDKDCMLIETDDSNPDVANIYQTIIPTEKIALSSDSDTWSNLLDVLAENTGRHIVINSAARHNTAVKENGSLLDMVIADKSLDLNLFTLWPLSRHMDCVRLLEEYLASITTSKIFALKNLHFGKSDEFELYDDAVKNGEISVDGTLDFPALSDRVTYMFYSQGLPIHETVAHFEGLKKLGTVTTLKNWINKIATMFDQIHDVAGIPLN